MQARDPTVIFAGRCGGCENALIEYYYPLPHQHLAREFRLSTNFSQSGERTRQPHNLGRCKEDNISNVLSPVYCGLPSCRLLSAVYPERGYVKGSTKQTEAVDFTPQVPCAVDDKCGLPTAVHKTVKGLTRCECLCLARNLQGSQGTLARTAWAFPLRIDHFNAEDKLLGNCWSVEEPWRSLQSHGKRVSPVRYPDEEVRDWA